MLHLIKWRVDSLRKQGMQEEVEEQSTARQVQVTLPESDLYILQ